ncbi:MAG TPA: addiction module protein [Blastocatellia bacterium]|nr:addiction module protein [Blastocatellia bacterium]
MAETSIPLPSGFTDMSKADQVRYLQDLWDHIADSPGEIPVPESHFQLVEARLKRHRNDPSAARSAFEVLDRLTKTPK